MGLTKYKLGELIEYCDNRNNEGLFSESDVRGISNTKELMQTKADLLNRSLKDFKIVHPNEFVYNRRTTRMGDKVAITLNTTEKSVILTNDYIVFRVKREDIILTEYLFMFFNRPEFDRYVRFNSWGSATEMFVWESMCDVDITLPSVEQQRKCVNVYLSLQKNYEAYQSKLEDLKLVCDGYIEKLRRDCKKSHSNKMVRVGDYITKRNEVNSDGKIKLEQGINIQKQFITPQRSNSNLLGRRIVRKGDIAYCTQLNNANVAVAYRDGDDCVVSSVYDIIYVTDQSILLPKYLMLWLVRPEFGRFVYTCSTGSAYEFLSFDDLADYKIPLPEVPIQQAIVNMYDCYNERQRIATQLKEQLKNLCPILIKGSLQTEK